MFEEYLLQRLGPHAVITMPAEIDLTNADQVCQALLAAVSPGVAVLVIDMSRTTFCDSAGVHAVISAYRHAATTGTQLRLVATTVLRIFTIIGADEVIPLYPTLDEALADAAPAPAASGDPGDGRR
ncbi:MAG TPA: STAS domain-containing protein [Streptosporangiaceae bacterium]|jgi:anti-sigma B factor antagonist|nr:STAS domain-containing protein [Streptosporangiaceae bacterium]